MLWHSYTMQALAGRKDDSLVFWHPLTSDLETLPTGQTPIWHGTPDFGVVDGRACCTMPANCWVRAAVAGFEQDAFVPFTAACWVRAGSGRRVYICLGNYQTKAGTFSYYRNNSRQWLLTSGCNFGNEMDRPGEWLHGVATYASEGTARLYINGKLFRERQRKLFGTSFTDAMMGQNIAENYTGASEFSFSDARIYNRVLNASEIARIYEETLSA